MISECHESFFGVADGSSAAVIDMLGFSPFLAVLVEGIRFFIELGFSGDEGVEH